MLDLALADDVDVSEGLFLVAPNNRELDVKEQIQRPAFRHILDLNIRYLPYGELENHKDQIARFGSGIKGIHAISKKIN